LFLLLPGVLVFPDTGDRLREDFEAERLNRSNDSLEAQLKALQDTRRERACRAAPGETVPVPGARPEGADNAQPVPQMELVPRPPERVPLQPRGEQAPQAENIAQLLEKATVLVVAPLVRGESLGTGFFIDERHIVTNHHVVEGAQAQTVFIASRAINGVRRGRVVALTQPPPVENDVRPDFAVVEVEPVAGASALKLTVTPPKLSTAYVAGYPAFLVERDANFAKLFRQLGASIGQGDIDRILAGQQFAVPGVDLRSGRVNNLMKTGRAELPVIIHDMQLAKGNSGGPLVDSCGRLGGVNTLLFPNDEAGYQQGNVAQDVTLLRKFLTENGVSFSADDGPCGAVGGSGPQVPQPPQTPPPNAPRALEHN
jgi:S1-C subfamily serine protease